ncbi:MAG: hypothetical protein Athens041674_510, partial [Parcubacteria group bacterium Athens0416_74]
KLSKSYILLINSGEPSTEDFKLMSILGLYAQCTLKDVSEFEMGGHAWSATDALLANAYAIILSPGQPDREISPSQSIRYEYIMRSWRKSKSRMVVLLGENIPEFLKEANLLSDRALLVHCTSLECYSKYEYNARRVVAFAVLGNPTAELSGVSPIEDSESPYR